MRAMEIVRGQTQGEADMAARTCTYRWGSKKADR